MEQDFIVRTHREGTVDTDTAIEDTLNTMGCDGFKNRYLGSVTAIVERERGVNTKEKLNWGADNDPKFNETMKANADRLLSAVKRAVEGGGNDGELRVRLIAKL